MQPTSETSINCYVNADFAGIWSQKDHNNENWFKSRTGCVICISNFPILLINCLPEGIALSIMEAEHLALSMAMDDLLTFKWMIKSIFTVLGLKRIKNSYFLDCVRRKCKSSCPRKTRTTLDDTKIKHYAVKYHWFGLAYHQRTFKFWKSNQSINEQINLLKAWWNILLNIFESC